MTSKAHVLDALAFYVSAVGESLSYPGELNVSLIAAFPEKATTVYTGDWKGINEGITKLVNHLLEESTTGTEVFEAPIAQAISKALASISKNKKPNKSGKIIILECSNEVTDFSTQSVPISNCGCAANGTCEGVPLASVSVVSLASKTPSSALLGLCLKTGGVHIPKDKCLDCGSLLQALMFHLVPSDVSSKTLKTRPQSQRTHMSTTCVCHNKSVDKGYVCSVCLAIYCTETAGICSVCGSRIRREAKDELPIHAQTFSKLFPVSNLGPVFSVPQI